MQFLVNERKRITSGVVAVHVVHVAYDIFVVDDI